MLKILLSKDAMKYFRITIDTAVENTINLHLTDGKVLNFKDMESGLYLLHIGNHNNTTKNVSAYSFLTLVKANKAKLTRI